MVAQVAPGSDSGLGSLAGSGAGGGSDISTWPSMVVTGGPHDIKSVAPFLPPDRLHGGQTDERPSAKSLPPFRVAECMSDIGGAIVEKLENKLEAHLNTVEEVERKQQAWQERQSVRLLRVLEWQSALLLRVLDALRKDDHPDIAGESQVNGSVS
mmetsp:Transcript_19542/g.41635  ORF Transcript_19542/g.41635 Transcript_19542/m.41635 type:complete len:155 (-) Transcript_19542:83-547(-)